ncbi:amidohydrolase [Chakrabartyella piscis]|uniref:amidohydrolase n=1 Tax=Chakrabartyella piscis TaxID=2918914 RepID=UPI002958793F|nr:amidohydrolase [Chakrabartyella piscis]
MNFDFSYVDIAFQNGTIITVNESDGVVEAIGIKGNKVVFAGSNADLAKIIDANTKVYDLAGRSVMPGINDSHYHPILNGMLGEELDSAMIDTTMKYCKTLGDMLDLVAKAVAVKEKGEWISMMGYEPLLFPEKRHPTIEELDAIAPENPVHCMHGGGHICMYNHKALEYLDVYTAEDASKYPVDEVEVIDGKLTGLVRGHTHFWLWGKVVYTEAQQQKAAMKSHQQCLEKGITSVGDMGECDAPSYHVMQKLCRDGIFKVRTYMALHSIFGKPFSKEDNEHFLSLGLMTGLGDEKFRIGPCKFMIDGGSGGPSCATREPYSHNPDLPREKGWDLEETIEYIKMIDKAECQCTAHAIGDEAIEYMVKGYEAAFAENPDLPKLRHRIEHCTLVDPDLIARMAKMNICPSVNAGLVSYLGANYALFYGEERNKYLGALRSMMDAGVMCSLHSDAPSGPCGMAMIDGAVNRYDRKQEVQCDKTQAVSLLEAIRCATYNAAYQSYEENIKGSLEIGKLADLIVLDRDIVHMDTMDLNQVQVDMTMIDGEIVFTR